MSLYRLNKRSEIMLCYPFEEKRLAKWEPPYFVQPKLDGVRCRAIKDTDVHGGVVLLSSECNEIWSVPHINYALESIMEDRPNGFELDGELYVHGWDFSSINSVVSRTKQFHPDYEKLEYHIFDYVNEEFPQWMRLQEILSLPTSDKTSIVRNHACNSLESVMNIFDMFVQEGYEGIVLRHPEAPYVRKRSTYLMKFKPKKSDIYLIVGYNEEISISGEPKNSLGSLVCMSDENETFSVGTGFTSDQRKELWSKKDLLLGKRAKVSYQHTTPGRGVPRFPVFVEVLK